jgi:adenylate cyclase class 2
MALEIEAKFRVDSHKAVRARLQELGAVLVDRFLEVNRILDQTDGSLRRAGCGLRVRSSRSEIRGTTTASVTFKGPVVPGAFKTREEIGTTVGDAAAAVQLLERLGFTVILSFEKRRERWQLGECVVELDEPARIGRFVEIEGPSESAIQSARKSLGLEELSHITSSYIRMILDYCQEHRIAERELRLL